MATCEDVRQVMTDALNGIKASDAAMREFDEHVSSCAVCLPWLRQIEDALAGRYRPARLRGGDARDAAHAPGATHLPAVPDETTDAPPAE